MLCSHTTMLLLRGEDGSRSSWHQGKQYSVRWYLFWEPVLRAVLTNLAWVSTSTSLLTAVKGPMQTSLVRERQAALRWQVPVPGMA